MNRPCRIPRLALLLLATALPCLAAGCSRSPDVSSRRASPGQEPDRRPSDNLELAMQFLSLADQLEAEQARAQCAYHINRWIETQTADTEWLADPMLARVRSQVRGAVDSQSLARLRFTLDDVRYLQQAHWARDVTRWVATQPAPEGLRRWLAERPAGLSEDDAERLAVAERLFDWTIRNIQLDPLPEYPRDAAAGPGLDAGQTTATGPSLGAARGVPGPGYVHYPWQTMLYGHGDAWARARVFMLLCRQQQLDTVMLALDAPGLRPSPYPWLPAVLLGGQLFLFDTQLGLPLPGPDGRGIATLTQVREDPALLSSLDVGTMYVYPVRADQVQTLVALVDASPPALSRQMEMVERRLAGDDKLVLTVSPGRIARQLANVPGIRSTALWDVPFETEQFRAVLPRLAANNPDLARELYRGELIYEGSHPLVMGRRLAFRGVFESTPDQVGAKAMFLDSRTPDSIIDNLERDSEARMRIGLEGNLPADPVAARNLLENARVLLRESRQLASFWLGLAQYDTGRYPDAIDWLDKRTLQADPQGRWAGGARYNLGRTHEVLGQFERARELYFADESPQAHGNRLRARSFPRDAGTAAP